MDNDNQSFAVKVNEFLYSLNAVDVTKADIIQTAPDAYNLIKNSCSVNAKLLSIDGTGKKLTIDIDGEVYEVAIKDQLDQMLEKMGFGLASVKLIKEVKAPMPGMVLEISVEEGQEVKESDRVVILGAMKMENSILVATNAKIKRIAVKVGQAVDKGQVLVELE